MITREDLIKSSEYWTEIIQNKIYNDLAEYIETHEIQNKQIAESLGLSKGRVSQILSGENLNFRLDTLVKLCLTINRIPDFQLVDINEFIAKDKENTESIIFKSTKSYNKPVNETQKYKPVLNPEFFKLRFAGLITTGETMDNTDTPFTDQKAA